MKYVVTYSQNGDMHWPVSARTEIEINGKRESLYACGKDADEATESLIRKIKHLTTVQIPEPCEIEV